MFSTLCVITADTSRVTKIPHRGLTGDQYYTQDFNIVVLFGLTELKAQITWIENVRRPLNLRSYHPLQFYPHWQGQEKR